MIRASVAAPILAFTLTLSGPPYLRRYGVLVTVTGSPAGLMSSCDHSHTITHHSWIRINGPSKLMTWEVLWLMYCEQVVHSLA